MIRRFTRLLVVSLVATVIVTAAPFTSNASVAMAPCQGAQFISVHEWQQTITLVGAYTSPGAIDVSLTCGVVRQGVTVARVSEDIPGPVAALAENVTVLGGTITICYELNVTYLDRPPTVSDTCP